MQIFSHLEVSGMSAWVVVGGCSVCVCFNVAGSLCVFVSSPQAVDVTQ